LSLNDGEVCRMPKTVAASASMAKVIGTKSPSGATVVGSKKTCFELGYTGSIRGHDGYESYGKEPPKRRVIFQGRPINENAYFEPDVDLLREAIREVMGL